MERFITRSNSVGKRPLEGPVDTSEWKIPKFGLPASGQRKPEPVKTSNRFSVLRTSQPQEIDIFAALPRMLLLQGENQAISHQSF